MKRRNVLLLTLVCFLVLPAMASDEAIESPRSASTIELDEESAENQLNPGECEADADLELPTPVEPSAHAQTSPVGQMIRCDFECANGVSGVRLYNGLNCDEAYDRTFNFCVQFGGATHINCDICW